MARLIKPAYTLYLVTGNSCQAGCISCPAGRKEKTEPQVGGMMKPDMLARILDRVLEQATVTTCLLHYYNEPCLNPHMADLVEVCHSRGLNCLMSTNGAFLAPLLKIMKAGLEHLVFSASGWTNEIHQISHANVDIEVVKENMKSVAAVRAKDQFVRVAWHRYNYNINDEWKMGEFCEQLGFCFTPYDTGVLPLERPIEMFYKLRADPNTPEDPAERDLRTKLKEAAALCDARRHWPCSHQQRMIAVDSNGDLYNCNTQIGEHNKRTSIFDVCLEDFNHKRYSDPECVRCKAVGGHVYAMQHYREPVGITGDLTRLAGAAWRSSGLGGQFPGLSKWWSQRVFRRPMKRDFK